MKKILFLSAILAFAPLAAAAKSVVFTLDNGTLVYYLLGGEKNPVMRFTDNQCVVNTDTYEFSQIKDFYISETDDPNAIKQIETARKFSFKDNVLVVKSDGRQVLVYSVSGIETAAEVVTDGGYATVDLSQCAKGAYIIKAGDSSFKVIKK